MVQLEPNMALTLKNLAPFGAVVSAEQQVREEQRAVCLCEGCRTREVVTAIRIVLRITCTGILIAREAAHVHAAAAYNIVVSHTLLQAALDHSVTIKRVEAGLSSLVFWGKVTTINGKVGWPPDASPCWAKVVGSPASRTPASR